MASHDLLQEQHQSALALAPWPRVRTVLECLHLQAISGHLSVAGPLIWCRGISDGEKSHLRTKLLSLLDQEDTQVCLVSLVHGLCVLCHIAKD